MTRLIAICLLLLAASPFTAPFSTCDLASVWSTAPAADAAKTKHAHDDVLAVRVFIVVAGVGQGSDDLSAAHATPAGRYSGHHTILRL